MKILANIVENQKLTQALKVLKIIGWVLLIVTGLILVYWSMSLVYEKFFKPEAEKNGTEENQHVKTEETVKSDLNKQITENKKFPLSYTSSFYSTVADYIQDKLLNGDGLSTSFSLLWPYLSKMKNYTDILQLKQTFGVREMGIIGFKSRYTLDEALSKWADYKTNATWRETSRALSELQNKYLKK
jgi:Na+-transporting methylmalonyl-CoA/oxaloacetate decarboxylase gamma subunit